MDAYWVEMALFLHLNFKHIPDEIPQIQARKIRDHIPARFSGRDDELKYAEEDLDEECAKLSDTEDVTTSLGTDESDEVVKREVATKKRRRGTSAVQTTIRLDGGTIE